MKANPARPRRVIEVTPLPTYEYHCPNCKATYELRQGFDAETTHACEECGEGTARRVLHAPPIVFKGSGWYVTDSRNKSSALTDSTESADSAPSEPASTPAPATSAEASAAQ